MKAIDQRVNESLQTLNAILLSTLDETLFFAKLSGAVNEYLFNNEVVRTYIALEDGNAQLISENGKAINDSKVLEKGKGLAGHVIRTKRAYYSNSVRRDPLLSEIEYDFEVVGELSVPIMLDGTILGTVHVLSKDDERKFDESDVAHINELLNTLKAPISNMKMYLMAKNLNRALTRKIEEKEKELQERKVDFAVGSNSNIEDLPLIGQSPNFNELKQRASKIAASNSNIMITGEPGTGKELIAKRIHNESLRSEGPFIVFNCSSVEESHLESELFGMDKGLTGPGLSKIGLLEKTSGGTLILDDFTKLNLLLQAKLLRFVETGEAYRIGSHAPFHSNVRIISITNSDIEKEVAEQRMREDLYYRLGTVILRVPSLRERKDDIRVLAEHFLNEGSRDDKVKSLTYGAVQVLTDYHWPGNIREIKNVMERVRVLSESAYIDAHDLPETVKSRPEAVVNEKENFFEMTLEELEKKHICNTLKNLEGNKTRTAKVLGITVKTLYNKLHSYGMVEPRAN